MKPQALLTLISVFALHIFTLCGATALYGATGRSVSESLEQKLSSLDSVLSDAGRYEAVKQSRISSLEEKYASAQPEQKFYLGRSLIEECLSYDFDKAQSYLRQNLELALAAADRTKTEESLIRLAYFYASSGFYYEADEILNGRLKGLSFGNTNYLLYCLAQQNLYNEVLNHSAMPYSDPHSVEMANFYTSVLLEKLPHDSSDWIRLKIIDLLADQEVGEAEKICDSALGLFCTQPRKYALAAYLRAILCAASDDVESMAHWYAVAATEYARLCVKDNNSLYILSTLLYDLGDWQRAERYAAVALKNSSEYDRNLRYSQVAEYLGRLDSMEAEAKAGQKRIFTVAFAIVTSFALVLVLVLVFLFAVNRRLRRAKRLLKARNDEISALNSRLSAQSAEILESNRVKEEYIGMFLMKSSEKVDSVTASKDLENFYRNFDTIFLNIYPSFVEDFNALLHSGAEITPPKGSLTPELRIFALVRLGISDSTKIASLLHYSVQTIYNYRGKIKALARDREGFEESVRRIGSFSLS